MKQDLLQETIGNRQILREIYLDNASLARPSERIISAMIPFFTEYWGAMSSPHHKGQQLYPAVEAAYREIYRLFGNHEKDTFILTSSSAEAINQTILSAYFDITLSTGKNHFVTGITDDAPMILALGRLEKVHCVGKMVQVNQDGLVTASALGDVLTPRTALVSLSWAHGLTGVVQPIAEISKVCKERGILFHLDVTHALGKLYFEWEDLGADLLTFNGPQLHAPKGTGGIYLREGVRLTPLIVGGIEQGGYRAGDLDIPGLIALGEAAKEMIESRDYICTEVARLRNKMETEIINQVPEAKVMFSDQERLPHCSTMAFPGIPNEAMLYALHRQGLYANIGGGNFQQIGAILLSCGIAEDLAQTAISFTLSRETTEEEIDLAIETIVQTTKKLRKLATHI